MRNVLLILTLIFPLSLLQAQTANVTFQVDMSDYPGSYNIVNLNGTFNSWCGGCNAMTDTNNDSIFEITLAIPYGVIEYKYTTDGWTSQENLIPGLSCTQTASGYTNRVLTLSGDTTLPVVCWESCTACTGASTSGNVTFKVDLSNYTGSFTSAYVNGTFNNWCGSCNPMTDADGDSIWETTLPLQNGTIEYKFTLDGWNVDETLMAGSPCTQTTGGFTNRVLTFAGDTTLEAVCWESCSPCAFIPDTADVTFKVDMTQYTGASYSTVYVNGTFNGWCGSCNPLSDPDGDSIWEATLPIPEGNIDYKFTLDGWNVDESLSSGLPCTSTSGGFTNRTLMVENDTVLPEVCWESCDPCTSIPDTADITFKVDLSQYSGASFTTAYVNGTFNGWCGSCNPMTDADGDGIWETTLPVPHGNHEYKFTLDGWNIDENLTSGSTCTMTNTGGFTNRALTVSGDSVLPAVCWESCDPCPPPTYDVTFSVDMSNDTNTFSSVYVNGSFNGWCGSCNPLSDPDGDDIWDVTLPLPAGQIEFKYTLDGWNIEENLNPAGSCVVSNGGFTNRFLVVSGDTTLPTVCWESCDSCNAVPPYADVTFKVDLSNYAGSFTSAYVNGDFNSWCGNCNPMSDADGDGIWETTLPINKGTIEYKFTLDGWNAQEMLDSNLTCVITTNGFTNRVLNFNADTVLPVVCWESCTTCPPPTNDVTFSVDMSNDTSTYSSVYINGTFNNWCGTCNPLSDADGDDIWEVTLALPDGPIEYKYTLDGWNIQENLVPGSSCTFTNSGGFTNRYLDITGDTILPTVCWESCDSCTTAPTSADVTLKVDMSNYTGNFTTVYASGTFNGWCGTCNPLADPDGDSIWETTINIPFGNFEYKFTIDDWSADESLVAGSFCTVTNFGFTNRALTVTSDTVLPLVCWESCEECLNIPPTGMVTFRVDLSTYSGSFGTAYVNGSFNSWCGTCNPMSDADGDGIWEVTLSLNTGFVEYKFTLDGWNIQENLTPGSACTFTSGGFTNRALNHIGDTILDLVCWETCSSCLSVNGMVHYANAAQTPLNNVTVTLNDMAMTPLATTISNNGSYEFLNLNATSYQLSASSQEAWSGGNSADALWIIRHFVGLHHLQGIEIDAADVNIDGVVNSNDALFVARRFVGLISSFPSEEWVFESPVINPVSGIVTQDIAGLCYGDVNASAFGVKQDNTQAQLIYRNEFIKPNEGIAIQSETSFSSSSMSLILGLSEGVNILDVRSSMSGGEFLWNVIDGQLRISWFSIQPMDLHEGETLFSVFIDNNDVLIDGTSINLLDGSQFTDAEGLPASGVKISLPQMLNSNASMRIYPNPASSSNKIELTLPVSLSQARIRITDLSGKLVSIKNLGSLSAGKNTIELDNAHWKAGSYVVHFDGMDMDNEAVLLNDILLRE